MDTPGKNAHNSLSNFSGVLPLTLCSDPELTTEHVINQHRAKTLYEYSHNALRITVRRGHILDDVISCFDEKKHVCVTLSLNSHPYANV